MTEMEIINQFNVFLISNSVYLAAGAFLIWVAFRMVVNVQSDPGTPMLNLYIPKTESVISNKCKLINPK